MPINTIIDVGNRRTAPVVVSRPRATVQNRNADEQRSHQEVLEYRHRVSVLNANLMAATTALAAANAEIIRLNDLNASLKQKLNAINAEQSDKSLEQEQVFHGGEVPAPPTETITKTSRRFKKNKPTEPS